MELLQKVIRSIVPVDNSLRDKIQSHLDSLTKPQGSLGGLEALAMRYCLITRTIKPSLGKKKIFTFAADHGVTEEGISAFPRTVTPQMVRNMLAGGAAINVLARHAGAEVCVIDMGVDEDFKGTAGLIDLKIGRGTRNFMLGPAMSEQDAVSALRAGIQLAQKAAQEGISLIGTGDMGIGNTTASSALMAVLLPCGAEEITGKGTGVSSAGLSKKITVIKKSLEINKSRLASPLGALAAVGGFEIAGICGLVLGAASNRIPIVVDGFISSAAALVACRMCESVKDYLFFSHCSGEKGHKTFFLMFGATPVLDLAMRLGEGTGAALAMPIIEAAVKIYNEMETFSSAGVSEKSDERE
jgi:nicotinate-nucleotide--dimethylbenzimidazole phosphoribosyltransferase